MFVYLSKNIFSCLEWKAETLPLGHEGQKRSNKCRYCLVHRKKGREVKKKVQLKNQFAINEFKSKL